MADPQIDAIRVQVILPSVTNMVRDDIVNSWAFKDLNKASGGLPNMTVERMNLVFDALNAFYVGMPSMRPSQLVTGQLRYKAYQLSDPPGVKGTSQAPRQPYATERTAATISQTNLLPEEAAVCLSLHGARNLPRTRGRIFLGPWGASAAEAANGRVRVLTTLREAIRTRAQTLRNTLATAGIQWGIISQRDGAFVPCLGGWVDDSFDTQRRRGTASLTREVFTLPSVTSGQGGGGGF